MKLVLCALALLVAVGAAAQEIRVGSKKFPESYVLGEITKRILHDAGLDASHRQGMGGTDILWTALTSGQIDVYPEYTGTITEAILRSKERLSTEQIAQQLKDMGIGMSPELGFNNTYALVMKKRRAEQLGIRKISDLKSHPELRAGPTHEFLGRAQDGWRPLAQRYGLKMADVRGIEHAIGYRALDTGDIDIKDAYSTDADIETEDLLVLEDDLEFFPRYRAVLIYRLELAESARRALDGIGGSIDEATMIKLNVLAMRTKNYDRAAAEYFRMRADRGSEASRSYEEPAMSNVVRATRQHVKLVAISMALAILIGLPLGIWAAQKRWTGGIILSAVGLIQTVPSLALLAIFVPLLSIGEGPAIAALFLYSLLPIVRNTASGLQDIAPGIRESAAALGLEPSARLFKVFLPIASRTILAGIKTSVIINIGTATIAALVGAGGLGDPIIQGISLRSYDLILQGLIPAAILALLVQFAFDLLDRVLIPRGLRLEVAAR